MSIADFLVKMAAADTPAKVLALIVENEELFGYDPFYVQSPGEGEVREAMLQQARVVLGMPKPHDYSLGDDDWAKPNCMP